MEPQGRVSCAFLSRSQRSDTSQWIPTHPVLCWQIRKTLLPTARVFVAVDAPKLQQAVSEYAGGAAFLTPGVGVDPTNEYRDGKAPGDYQEQHVGKQDLAERNLIKVGQRERDGGGGGSSGAGGERGRG